MPLGAHIRPRAALVLLRMPEARDGFLTVADVAAIPKLNQQTVRNWIEPGIPGLIHYPRLSRF
jgi:hypothetical protein